MTRNTSFPGIVAILSLLTALLASAIARGADVLPTTRPEGFVRPGGAGGSGGRMGWPAPSDEQWTETAEFARTNAPNRFKAFEALPDENPRKARLKGFMYYMYRRLLDHKEDDPKLYDMRLSRIRLEDSIYGLVNQLRAPVASPDAAALQASLKQKIGEWIDLGIQERQQRIERLEQSIVVEKQKLADDKTKRNQNVDERTERVLKEGEMLDRPGGGRGFRGMRERRGDGAPGAAPAAEESTNGQAK